MKKIIVFLLVVGLFFFSACTKEVTYELTLNEDNVTLYVGDVYEVDYTATANGKEADLDVTLITSSTKVTIEGSSITPLSVGTANITVVLDEDQTLLKALTVTIVNPLVITESLDEIFVGENITLSVDDLRSADRLGTLTWSTDAPGVATVENGIVTGVGSGTATITVESEEGLTARKDITVMYRTITGISINPLEETLYIFGSTTLEATVTPSNADGRITWSSSDTDIASIDENGNITAHSVGTVTITATSVANSTIQATYEFDIEIDPIAIMASLNNPNPINQLVTTYGNTELQQTVYGSVSDYFFSTLNLIDQTANTPITLLGGTGLTNTYAGLTATPAMLLEAEPKKFTRSGILHPETTYITYHDTGNNSAGANAMMHQNYLVGSYNLSDRARSWHYTVDDDSVVHHIPDNEVTWQGDSYTSYAYSIGIETAVDFGSDLYATWHRTAKLMAQLMITYDIPFENIVQHYDWNGKNCPQTLRRNNLYPKAMEMVQAEFMVATYLSEYTMTMTSLNPEYVDNRGRVVALPETATRIGYLVRIQKGEYDESIILYSNLPGQDSTTTPVLPGTGTDLEAAEIFDQGVANLPYTVTATDDGDIKAMRIAYNCLSEVQRSLVTTLDYLEAKELALHGLDAVATPLVIHEIYSSDNDTLSHGFVEIYNTTNQDISLNGYALQINNGASTSVFTFAATASIGPKKTYLVQFEATANSNGTYLPLPDDVSTIHLSKNGFVALTNSLEPLASATGANVIDFVGMGTGALFEGVATSSANQDNRSITRWGSIDTNQNATDFKSTLPTPQNSNGHLIDTDMSDNEKAARSVDLLILALPHELTTDDQSKVATTRTSYNDLSSEVKGLVTLLPLLEAKETEIEGLLDPNLQVINQAIATMSRHITDDYVLPTAGGIVWSYKAGQDTSYFDIATGTYLRLSYGYKPITLVATVNTTSKEILINFGVLEAGQKSIFYTGASLPAAGQNTGDGKGTAAEQAAKVGFAGIALVVDGKVYYVAEKSYIPLSDALSGSTLMMEDLRPYGSSSDSSAAYNQSLVRGVPTGYAGAGTLYENTSNVDLSFDPSFTYGRNNSGAYGYAKVVFSPNGDGTYTIKTAWENSGTNTSTSGLTKTLKPGELLWCPHTYDTNATMGTWCTQPGTSTLGTPALIVDHQITLVFFKTSFTN
ncbi:MAG: Ig-like domain-containing protein [Bacilli bacterium]|nr:Ig-like domain-containing protein [Bacilli bacterium]